MAKRSRRGSREDIESARPVTSNATRSAASTPPATRTTRRARPGRRARQQGLLERYRSVLIGGAAVAGLLLLGFILFSGSTRAAYECSTLLSPGPAESLTPRPATPTPTLSPSPVAATPAASPDGSPTAAPTGSPDTSPTASPAASPDATPSPDASPSPSPLPAPEPTPRLGFTTTILGRDHVTDPTRTLRYGFCPPTSGDHFEAPRGPIRADFYPATEERHPGGWVHNLEHGYVVLLYRCPSGEDCPSDAEMAEMRAFFDNAPDSGIAACPRKVLVARFDEMSTRFALVAWGRALLMDEFDIDTARTFVQQWMDHEAVPEAGAC